MAGVGALLDALSLLLYGLLALLVAGFWLWLLGSRLLGWPGPRDVVDRGGDGE